MFFYLLFFLNSSAQSNLDKSFVKKLIDDSKNEANDILIIDMKCANTNEQFEIAISDFRLQQYYNRHHSNSKQRKYFKFLKKAVLKKEVLLVDSLECFELKSEIIFKETLKKFENLSTDELLNKYCDINNFLIGNYKDGTLLAIVKILFNNEIIVYIDDISGDYRVARPPQQNKN